MKKLLALVLVLMLLLLSACGEQKSGYKTSEEAAREMAAAFLRDDMDAVKALHGEVFAESAVELSCHYLPYYQTLLSETYTYDTSDPQAFKVEYSTTLSNTQNAERFTEVLGNLGQYKEGGTPTEIHIITLSMPAKVGDADTQMLIEVICLLINSRWRPLFNSLS